MKTKLKLMMTVLLLLLVSTSGTAQEDEQPQKWTIPEEGSFPLAELLPLYANHADINFMYDPKKLAGEVTPKETDRGRELEGEAIDLFFSDSLEEFKLTTAKGNFMWEVISTSEATWRASVISEDELAKADDWLWACVFVRVEGADLNELAKELREESYRPGGMVHVQGDLLILVDRVDRLKKLVKLVRETDRSPTYERYPVNNPKTAFATLFKKFEGRPASIAIAPGGKHIVARADAKLQQEIAEAVAALD